MTQNSDVSSKNTIIDTGETPEARALLKNAKIFDNLDQNIIRITEDKLKLILKDYQSDIEDKKAWQNPLGIFITLILTLLTTQNFKNLFHIQASVWQAAFYIATFLVCIWLISTSYNSFLKRKISIQTIIDEAKQTPKDNNQ